jgi:two-component system, OmpR family, KDP operon response regulator KdpE
VKVLIIDADPHVLDALSVGLQLQWQDCEIVTAAGGEAGEQAFFDHVPDVVLLDPALPDRSGYDVLRAIRRVSDVPVLVLSARGAETDQVKGLERGADDYLVKPVGQLVLLARIKAVLRRAELPPPVNAQPDFVAGDLAIHFQSHQVTLRGAPVRLTPVEYKLLYHLVRNAGHLLPHQALLDRVWGEDDGATTHHLKVFVSRLRGKLEPAGGVGPRYIETERGLGYRFARPSDLRPTAAPPAPVTPLRPLAPIGAVAMAGSDAA